MKKFLGFLLMIIGGYIAISLFVQIPSTIEKFKDTSKIEAENPQSYIIGVIIAGVLLLVISMSAIYFGFQTLKKANREAAIKKAETAILMKEQHARSVKKK